MRYRSWMEDDKLARLRDAFSHPCVSAWLGHAEVLFLGFGDAAFRARSHEGAPRQKSPYELETNFAAWRVEGPVSAEWTDEGTGTALRANQRCRLAGWGTGGVVDADRPARAALEVQWLEDTRDRAMANVRRNIGCMGGRVTRRSDPGCLQQWPCRHCAGGSAGQRVVPVSESMRERSLVHVGAS